MATLTNEQIEQKKQLLAEKMKEMKALYDELVEAGAIALSEDDLDQAAGGVGAGLHPMFLKSRETDKDITRPKLRGV